MAYEFTVEEEAILNQLEIHEDSRVWPVTLDDKFKFGQTEIRGIAVLLRSLADAVPSIALLKNLTEGLYTRFVRLSCPPNQALSGRLFFRIQWASGAVQVGESFFAAVADGAGVHTFSIQGTPLGVVAPDEQVTALFDAESDGVTGYFFLRCQASSIFHATPEISFRVEFCDGGSSVEPIP